MKNKSEAGSDSERSEKKSRKSDKKKRNFKDRMSKKIQAEVAKALEEHDDAAAAGQLGSGGAGTRGGKIFIFM